MTLHRKTQPLLILTATLLTASCSQFSAKPEPLPKQEACHRLQALVADHSENFIHHRKNKRTLKSLNVWTGTKVFPISNRCEVWEWSTGLFSYVCNWKSNDGIESAKSDYTAGNDTIRACLDKSWTSRSKETQSGGEYTLFSSPTSKTFIEMRYFTLPRNIIKSWHTTITISDKSNLKADLQ